VLNLTGLNFQRQFRTRLSSTLSRFISGVFCSGVQLIKFSLAKVFVFVTIAALLSAWIASHYWFGPPRLRRVAVSDRILASDNKMMELENFVAIMWEDDNTNIRYKCPYCQSETKIPISETTGSDQFSAKDLSRFNTFTGLPGQNHFTDHYDIYCSDCGRPVRIVVNMGLTFATYADDNQKGSRSLKQVIESEF